MSKKILITAALPYANGPIHIGHLAGVYLPADIFARYQRRRGKEVVFVCGSDEHGIPITLRAKKEQRTPQQVVNEYHDLIQSTFQRLKISFDVYSRTSSQLHKETSQEFFLKLYHSGKLIEKEELLFYDEDAEEFLADRYIVGTCPKCSYDNAYGDQCEKCGTSLSPDELIQPRSILSGSKPIKKASKHWYLPLNEYEDFLRTWILKGHSHHWRSNVLGQVKSWLDEGLKPRAITRDLSWGVPVPLPQADGKVLYVWFEAPIGYISATKHWAQSNGKDWEAFWKDPNTKLYHFIAKDNIVFHCVIFPVMLHAHGEYILPENVPSNEFLNLENEKISTSRNWAVWVHEYLDDFPQGIDALRYVLTAIAPETKDSNFSWIDFQMRNNSELVAILGNFIHRVFVLMHKFFQGKVPAPSFDKHEKWHEAIELTYQVTLYLENLEFRNALQTYMNIARLGNQYLQSQQPWKTFQTQPQVTADCLFLSVQLVALLAQLGELFIPEAAEKICTVLNMELLPIDDILTNKWLIEPNRCIQHMQLLFEKIDDDKIHYQLKKLKSIEMNQTTKLEPLSNNLNKQLCTFDDFSKLDLRTCTIVSAEKVEHADKLLKLEVDTGLDRRVVVSGIAEHFSPTDLIGKQVVVVFNLAPRKIRGIDSHGMLLLAESNTGALTFIVPEQKIENGCIIR